jgi:hypothetical protein
MPNHDTCIVHVIRWLVDVAGAQHEDAMHVLGEECSGPPPRIVGNHRDGDDRIGEWLGGERQTLSSDRPT